MKGIMVICNISSKCVRSEVFTAVLLKIWVFRNASEEHW